MASTVRQFTLPNGRFRLEEISMPEELAVVLAGKAAAVEVLPEEQPRTRRIDLNNPPAGSVSVLVDDDATAWNKLQRIGGCWVSPCAPQSTLAN